MLQGSDLCLLMKSLRTGAYKRHVKLFELRKMVHFDRDILQEGLQGGSNVILVNKRLEGAATFDSTIDSTIVNTINHRHWSQIKRFIKLCDKITTIPKGQPGYDQFTRTG